MQDLEQTFYDNALFAEFSSIELSKLCREIDTKTIKAGDEIISIGEKLDHYYLIESGEVTVINELGVSKTLGKGNSFGDEALLEVGIALGAISAKTDCTILVLSSQSIINLESFKAVKSIISNNLLFNLGKKPRVNALAKIMPEQPPYLLNLVAWLLTIIVPLLTVYALTKLHYSPNQSQLLLMYVFLSALFMWVFRLVPEFVPALYLLLGMVLLSLAPAHVALSGFYANAFFLAISLSILGSIIGLSNLSYRLLLYLLKFNTSSKLWLHFVLFISGLFLTPIIPSANGRVSILYNLFNETISLFKVSKGSLEYQRLLASTIGGISLMSPIFLTSKTINLVALGMLSSQDQFSFQFYYWFLSASLVGLILLVCYGLLTWLLFPNKYISNIDVNLLKQQTKILNKITTAEVVVIVSTLSFIVIVFTSNIHNMPISWLAVFLAFFLFALGILKRDNFNHSINWDFLIFLAALLSFTNVMLYLEIDMWISHYMGWIGVIMNQSFINFVVILAVVIFLFRLVMPINIVVILLVSILVPVATTASNISPWLMVFITLLFAESYTYNVTASYIINFFTSIKDNSHYNRLLLLQLLLYVVKFLAVIVSIPFWVNLGLLPL